MLGNLSLLNLKNTVQNTVRYACRYRQGHNKSRIYNKDDAVQIEKFIKFYPR
jgi:hypothetical protein